MIITDEKLAAMAGVAPNANMRSISIALNNYGQRFGLDEPQRLAHYLAQLLHESGRFRYDREVWGPTPAQARYDERTDLGNTKARDGDGEKYMGRTAMQITGKANVTAFRDWCRKFIDANCPDFVEQPDLMNTDPWEGLGPIWYWATRKLNALADENNIEQITKKINGGLNGYADRVANYTRAALVLVGRTPTEVTQFQRQAKATGLYDGEPDGDPGPKTRAALHLTLAGAKSAETAIEDTAPSVRAAPVTETIVEEKQVAVAPKGSTKRLGNWLSGGIGFLTANAGSFFTQDLTTKILLLVVSAIAIGFLIWKGDVIARRIKEIVTQIGDDDDA